MATGSVVDQIVQSLAFEVEAIPQNDSGELANASNSTPLNLKIRVKKRDEYGMQQAILSVPKIGHPDAVPERIRLISSDQTIMSFDVAMEADFAKKPKRKPRKSFFGGCLGLQYDDDEISYLPSSLYKTKTADGNISSKSDGIIKQNFKLSKTKCKHSEFQSYKRNKKPDILGKCKPGGCLDPPFGEDKYAYEPIRKQKLERKITSIDEESPAHTNIKLSKPVEVPVTSTESKKSNDSLVVKKPKQKAEDNSILSIYEAKPKISLDSKYSDSVITYPPDISRSSITNNEKNLRSNATNESKQRKSFDDSIEAFFSSPRKTSRFSGKTSKENIFPRNGKPGTDEKLSPKNNILHMKEGLKNNGLEATKDKIKNVRDPKEASTSNSDRASLQKKDTYKDSGKPISPTSFTLTPINNDTDFNPISNDRRPIVNSTMNRQQEYPQNTKIQNHTNEITSPTFNDNDYNNKIDDDFVYMGDKNKSNSDFDTTATNLNGDPLRETTVLNHDKKNKNPVPIDDNIIQEFDVRDSDQRNFLQKKSNVNDLESPEQKVKHLSDVKNHVSSDTKQHTPPPNDFINYHSSRTSSLKQSNFYDSDDISKHANDQALTQATINRSNLTPSMPETQTMESEDAIVSRNLTKSLDQSIKNDISKAPKTEKDEISEFSLPKSLQDETLTNRSKDGDKIKNDDLLPEDIVANQDTDSILLLPDPLRDNKQETLTRGSDLSKSYFIAQNERQPLEKANTKLRKYNGQDISPKDNLSSSSKHISGHELIQDKKLNNENLSTLSYDDQTNIENTAELSSYVKSHDKSSEGSSKTSSNYTTNRVENNSQQLQELEAEIIKTESINLENIIKDIKDTDVSNLSNKTWNEADKINKMPETRLNEDSSKILDDKPQTFRSNDNVDAINKKERQEHNLVVPITKDFDKTGNDMRSIITNKNTRDQTGDQTKLNSDLLDTNSTQPLETKLKTFDDITTFDIPTSGSIQSNKSSKLKFKTSLDASNKSNDYDKITLGSKSSLRKEVINLELAFQSYVNDKKERTLKTLDTSNDLKRIPDDAITVVQSRLRPHVNEIRIPVDSDNEMTIGLKRTKSPTQRVQITEDGKAIQPMRHDSDVLNLENFNKADKHSNEFLDKIIDFEMQKVLNSIYEQELVPLQKTIKNLKHEIDIIFDQQSVLVDEMCNLMKTKPLRLIRVNPKCGCWRK